MLCALQLCDHGFPLLQLSAKLGYRDGEESGRPVSQRRGILKWNLWFYTFCLYNTLGQGLTTVGLSAGSLGVGVIVLLLVLIHLVLGLAYLVLIQTTHLLSISLEIQVGSAAEPAHIYLTFF